MGVLRRILVRRGRLVSRDVVLAVDAAHRVGHASRPDEAARLEVRNQLQGVPRSECSGHLRPRNVGLICPNPRAGGVEREVVTDQRTSAFVRPEHRQAIVFNISRESES